MLFNHQAETNSAGDLVLRYPGWVFVAAAISVVVLVVAAILETPGDIVDVFAGVVLLGGAAYMAVQSKKYRLVVSGDMARRESPWGSERSFRLSDIREIQIRYQAFHATLITRDGTEISVPFLLRGAFPFLKRVAEASEPEMEDGVRDYIARYAGSG